MGELQHNKAGQPSNSFGLTLINKEPLTPALAAQTTQLSKLKKEQGPEAVHALITKLLIELSDFVKIEATEAALVKWAFKLMQQFWHFKAAEISVCFDMGIEGKFGKIYGAVNYSTLVEWLNAYDQIKTEHATSQATKHKQTADASERSSLQGIKKLISNSDFHEKYNK